MSERNGVLPGNGSGGQNEIVKDAGGVASSAESDDANGVYEFKDPKSSGVVKVIKKWEDTKTNDERPVADMTISTQKPSRNPMGWTLTFDANGGSFFGGKTVNEMIYTESGSLVDGNYMMPTSDQGIFTGWYTEATGGTEVAFDASGKPTTPLTEDLTVYAHYQPPVKYAVAIYGIGVDDVKDEATGAIETGGLTFGPALGANYVQSYKNHTPTGQTTAGNAHRCVHDDSWDEIIVWNRTDPYVYEECIANGCTHSVPLSKNTTTTIFSSTFQPTTETGDGPSNLYYELVTGSCYENLRWHPNGGTYGTNSGGWGTTRIRAMLNGADELTDVGDSNYASDASSDINKSASIYTAENCLFAAFPQNLRDAIGARAVKYDSVYNSKTEANLKTSYDKLWLFSPNELGDTVSVSWADHPLEGRTYPKFAGTGNADNSNSVRRPYCIGNSIGNSTGITYWAWLRSSYSYGDNYALGLYGSGNVNYSYASYDYGVSPGFTLAR